MFRPTHPAREPTFGRRVVNHDGPEGSRKMEAAMPVILWLMGVPLLVVIALVVTHVI
jgi:hypothetical protein